MRCGRSMAQWGATVKRICMQICMSSLEDQGDPVGHAVRDGGLGAIVVDDSLEGGGHRASEAVREAERIYTLIGAGRLIAAPSGLSADLVQCLARAIARIMNDQAFHDSARAANRSLDLAEASEALADIRAATEDAQHFAGIVAAAIQRVRR